MSDDRHLTCPPLEDGSTDHASGERLANGRWAKGHCPNPRGRPPKPKPAPQDALRRALDETLPNAGGAGPMTMRDALIRASCVRGLKDPKVALMLLKLDQASWREQAGDEEADLAQDEDAVLDEFLARQARRPRPKGENEDGAP